MDLNLISNIRISKCSIEQASRRYAFSFPRVLAIIVDIRTIHSEVKQLSDNNQPLSSVNYNPVPGVLSFSQAREFAQKMDAPNP
jgi:hypothetical protein